MQSNIWPRYHKCSRGQLKCDGTRAETRFRLLAKWTSPFKSVGVSVRLTTGCRGARISGSNAGYTMFCGCVKGTGYPLHSPVSPSLPLPCITMCHHISTGVYQSGLHKCLYWTVSPVVDKSVSLICVSGLVQSVLGVSSTSYWETLLALVSLISPPSQQAILKLCTGYGKCIATVALAVLEREGPQRIRYPPHLPGDHMEN